MKTYYLVVEYGNPPYDEDDDIKYHVGRYPKCEQLNTELYGMDICTKCGQALKWGGK